MSQTALLLIDIQNDYFPTLEGSAWPLVGMEEAAAKARVLLERFRHLKAPIVHVRHEAQSARIPFFQPGTRGADIHASVSPLEVEPVIIKHKANSFLGTELQETLQELGVSKLVVVGAMTQNCIDSTVRAAADFGYECTVVADACATRDLEFEGQTIAAAMVQAAFLAALSFSFAKVVTAQDILSSSSA